MSYIHFYAFVQCSFKQALTSCKYIYIFIVAINSVIRLAVTVQILIVILNGKFTVLLLHLNSIKLYKLKMVYNLCFLHKFD